MKKSDWMTLLYTLVVAVGIGYFIHGLNQDNLVSVAIGSFGIAIAIPCLALASIYFFFEEKENREKKVQEAASTNSSRSQSI